MILVGGGLVLAGVVLGATLFGGRPVEAQAASYSTCFAGMQEVVDINDQGEVARPRQNRQVRVPEGWTIVSGGGIQARAVFIFCR
ncbi:MAG: hypothetical protein H6719_08370 [Sandaracinaceae bacterium]|nr:hypothetical protein [Sandaracinaceae bacterium]